MDDEFAPNDMGGHYAIKLMDKQSGAGRFPENGGEYAI